MKRQKEERNRGITLIALVITIIVLLILAAVSIAMLTGENGLLTRANEAKEEQVHATVKEGIMLAYQEYQLDLKTLGGLNSTKIATIQSIKIAASAPTVTKTTTFLDFLKMKEYVDTDGIVKCENLFHQKLSLGNGTGTKDVYKVEEQEENYILKYYNKEGTAKQLWSIAISVVETNYYAGELDGWKLCLLEKDTDLPTTFNEAYIVINGNRVNISGKIRSDNVIWDEATEEWKEWNYNYITNNISEMRDIEGVNEDGVYTFVIVKDGMEYTIEFELRGLPV